MAIKDDIYTFLVANTTITSLVPSSQIGWIDVDEIDDYPKIVYQMISSPVLYESIDEWQRWRFYCFSHSKTECRDIGVALIDLLHGLTDTMGDTYISLIIKIDESEVTRLENIYEKYIDFRIIYNG